MFDLTYSLEGEHREVGNDVYNINCEAGLVFADINDYYGNNTHQILINDHIVFYYSTPRSLTNDYSSDAATNTGGRFLPTIQDYINAIIDTPAECLYLVDPEVFCSPLTLEDFGKTPLAEKYAE